MNALGLFAAVAAEAAQESGGYRSLGLREVYNIFFIAPDGSTFRKTSATIR